MFSTPGAGALFGLEEAGETQESNLVGLVKVKKKGKKDKKKKVVLLKLVWIEFISFPQSRLNVCREKKTES